jgi:hypothetical protein
MAIGKQGTKAAALGLALCASACGSELLKDKGKSEDKSVPQVGAEVAFDGFVQRAFDIAVDSKSFHDTEDFFTRFIPELILSNPVYQAALKDAKITVSGDYGLETFGSNASVFMSSMAQDGHIFQARTDTTGKFTIKVKKSAQDETYKARVVLRIGLDIAYPNNMKENYCYILYGLRENISINENTKPIIFDDYKTQLNTYKCADATDDKFVIPGKDGQPSEIVVPNGDGSTSIEGAGGTKIDPYVKVASTAQNASPLRSDESGTNALVAVFWSGGRYYFVKGEVSSKNDGTKYAPLISMTGLDGTGVTQINSELNDPHRTFAAAGVVGDYFMTIGANSNSSAIYTGAGKLQADFTGGWTYPDAGTGTIFASNTGMKAVTTHGDFGSICDIDLEAPNIAKSCKNAPETNPKVSAPVGYACLKDNCYYLEKGGSLYKVNLNLVVQTKYAVSGLLIPYDERDSLKIMADSESLYFVTLKADIILTRKLTLVE